MVVRVLALNKPILKLESAAFILSLQVRQMFEKLGSDLSKQTILSQYLKFLICFMGRWNIARRWLEQPHFYQIGGNSATANVCFGFRWLYASKLAKALPDDVGFLMRRDHGVHGVNFERKVNYSYDGVFYEGRIFLHFVSTTTVPPASSMIILQDDGMGKGHLLQGMKVKPDTIQFTVERSICIVQMALHALLRDVWYKTWKRTIDEFHGICITEVSKPLPASPAIQTADTKLFTWVGDTVVKEIFRDLI